MEQNGSGDQNTRTSGRVMRDVLDALRERDLPVAREEQSLDELVSIMAMHRHSRVLYVVDQEQVLVGIVTLQALVSHYFRSSLDPHLDHRRLIDMAVNETARDLMRPHPALARENEDVQEVVRRMIGKGIMEIPVVDDSLRVLGDVTMIDLLAGC